MAGRQDAPPAVGPPLVEEKSTAAAVKGPVTEAAGQLTTGVGGGGATLTTPPL
jgi:hypothetical protein